MSDSTVDAWENLRVGDRVRIFVPGARNTRLDVFDLVELRLTEETLSPRVREAIADIRGSDGEVVTVSARILRPAQELA